MKPNLLIATALGALLCAQTNRAPAADVGFTDLFNGKDLAGWEGNPKLWSVKDGAIVGRTTRENPTKGNTFLIWTNGTLANFELRFSYQITPNNDKGFANSGVQYRSQIMDPANWVVGGYQADMEAGDNYSGILYEERMTRGIMAARGEKVVWDKDCKKQVTGAVGKSEEIQAAIKKVGWNDYVIIAQGNHLQHFINGHLTVDVTDECEAKAAKAGVLALQLHAGEPMTVQFRDLRLKQSTTASDLDHIQGEWKIKQLVLDGQAIDDATIADGKLVIKGNTFKLAAAGQNESGTLEFDAQASPKTMEASLQSGDTIPAIYDLNGPTLKICYAMNGAARPKEFKSTSGSDHVFVVYQRSQP